MHCSDNCLSRRGVLVVAFAESLLPFLPAPRATTEPLYLIPPPITASPTTTIHSGQNAAASQEERLQVEHLMLIVNAGPQRVALQASPLDRSRHSQVRLGESGCRHPQA